MPDSNHHHQLPTGADQRNELPHRWDHVSSRKKNISTQGNVRRQLSSFWTDMQWCLIPANWQQQYGWTLHEVKLSFYFSTFIQLWSNTFLDDELWCLYETEKCPFSCHLKAGSNLEISKYFLLLLPHEQSVSSLSSSSRFLLLFSAIYCCIVSLLCSRVLSVKVRVFRQLPDSRSANPCLKQAHQFGFSLSYKPWSVAWTLLHEESRWWGSQSVLSSGQQFWIFFFGTQCSASPRYIDRKNLGNLIFSSVKAKGIFHVSDRTLD